MSDDQLGLNWQVSVGGTPWEASDAATSEPIRFSVWTDGPDNIWTLDVEVGIWNGLPRITGVKTADYVPRVTRP